MKKLNIRLPHHLFTLTLTLTLGSALAAPVELHISQALATGTAITAYITVRDGAGAPIIGNPAAQFHATLGTQTVEIATVTPFNATNEGVLSLLLVDVSRSLDTAQFARIKQALRDWINALGEHDQAALLTFGDQVQTQVLPTADRTALLAAIETLAATDAHTALHQALAQGLALGRQQGAELPSRRALVILSDGLDDAPGGMTAEEVEVQLAKEGAVPIYAIGFSRVRERTQRLAGLAALGRWARHSGGLFTATDDTVLEQSFAAMQERIRAVDRMDLRCVSCVADGNRYRLRDDGLQSLSC